MKLMADVEASPIASDMRRRKRQALFAHPHGVRHFFLSEHATFAVVSHCHPVAEPGTESRVPRLPGVMPEGALFTRSAVYLL